MEVVLGHWDTWEAARVIMDKKSGRLGRSAKVENGSITKAQHYKSVRPFTVPALGSGPFP